MNDFDFNMDLDSILAEFSGGDFGVSDDAARPAEPDYPEEEQCDEEPVYEEEQSAEDSGYEEEAYEGPEYITDEESPYVSAPEEEPVYVKRSDLHRESAHEREEEGFSPVDTAKRAVSGIKRFVLAFTGLVFGIASVAVLAWMLVSVHPDTAMGSTAMATKLRADVSARLTTYAANTKGELLSDLTAYRKHFIIPEENLVAPEAPIYNFGYAKDPKEIAAVIEEARGYGLLDEDEAVIFNENVDFYYDSEIKYYCDETILVILWKELIDNRICSCVEVKVADGSQIRRKLAEDTYGSSTYVYATELAAQCNAVVAMNADYYAFRDLGITVYNRKLYRFDESAYSGTYDKYNATDTLFINNYGDFILFHKGEKTTREEMEKFIADNNIMFAIAFGPILVEDWGQTWTDWYPVGETDKEYSRAGIAQYGPRHYLYMTVSFADNENEYHPRCTVNEFAGLMKGKGVRTAYCLDGGQTGEIVFQGAPYNHIDFGTERTVSDIIYFASAIPASER